MRNRMKKAAERHRRARVDEKFVAAEVFHRMEYGLSLNAAQKKQMVANLLNGKDALDGVLR